VSEEVEVLRRLLARVEELNCTMREMVKGVERLRMELREDADEEVGLEGGER
jgi:hypothetical protein